MLSKWIEFINSLEVMSKLCDDKFDYEFSIGQHDVIELMIIEDDDILFSDEFCFTIFKNSIVFSYNHYWDINKEENFKKRQKFIKTYIDRIRKSLNCSDFDDREKVIKGEL